MGIIHQCSSNRSHHLRRRIRMQGQEAIRCSLAQHRHHHRAIPPLLHLDTIRIALLHKPCGSSNHHSLRSSIRLLTVCSILNNRCSIISTSSILHSNNSKCSINSLRHKCSILHSILHSKCSNLHKITSHRPEDTVPNHHIQHPTQQRIMAHYHQVTNHYPPPPPEQPSTPTYHPSTPNDPAANAPSPTVPTASSKEDSASPTAPNAKPAPTPDVPKT
mmetsp:Transcript_44464/g.79760  ORF Transcript_44464/g.79760 Transcript_44464/m.79760 type:complete len:218 (+) Transcript_44464:897-1550(+)